MIDYVDQSVLVTGAASGIGAALAKALAARGAYVVCADVNEAGLTETVATLGDSGEAIVCDLSDPNAGAALIAQAYESRGHLALVCSNAGIGHRAKVTDPELDFAAIERLFEINFYAGLRIANAYAQTLTETGAEGRLLVTTSETAMSLPKAIRNNRVPFYSGSKHALLGALEWLAVEQAQGPLGVHALIPGAVYTPLISGRLKDPANAWPELELIMPEACAELALKGVDLDLFYIPTQAHIADDMQSRQDGVRDALQQLDIKPAI
ncbi:MAG: SDR family oxidoreductase [Pseudomonadota bacterium]|nr:SDR family oxidoreductase [Pseudomonadota bacterium]